MYFSLHSLVKMVFGFVELSQQNPTWQEMLHAIRRNFGGLDHVNPEECFRENLATLIASNAPVIVLLNIIR